jgi:hypothetical protein
MRLTRNALRCGASLNALTIMALVTGGAQASLVISSAATRHVTCNTGVCTATAAHAILNVTDLQNLLATSAIKVVSDGSANDIDVAAALTWASANALTLDGYRSITITQPVSVAGPGALALLTNDGGTGGALSFHGAGSVTFLGLTNSLTINGATYTLIGDIATLAGDIAANPGGNFALAKNFNARRQTYTSSPIPTFFTGMFEGLGNAIANLMIDDTTTNDSAALFAELGTDSGSPGPTIADLRLTNANITGQGETGVLAAQSYNAFIDNVRVSGKVTGNGSGATGGLIGNFEWTGNNGPNFGVIANSEPTATVALTGAGNANAAGGLVGTLGGAGATISHSHATGTVTCAASDYIGGLVGDTSGSVIVDSYATGTVTSAATATAGGLLGEGGALSTIDSSYATGTASVAGEGGSAGGLAGGAFDTTIRNSYATGSAIVETDANAGGLVGGDYNGTYEYSYSIGQPSATGSFSVLGGVLGREEGPGPAATDIYWDTTTSGLGNAIGANGNSSGMTGQTTAQLQSALPAGFNPSIWGLNAGINGGFPYLLANFKP